MIARILIAVLALALVACTTPEPRPTTCPIPGGFESATGEVSRLANAFRAESSLAALAPNAALTQAAQDHACFMAETGTLSHTGAGGQ